MAQLCSPVVNDEMLAVTMHGAFSLGYWKVLNNACSSGTMQQQNKNFKNVHVDSSCLDQFYIRTIVIKFEAIELQVCVY